MQGQNSAQGKSLQEAHFVHSPNCLACGAAEETSDHTVSSSTAPWRPNFGGLSVSGATSSVRLGACTLFRQSREYRMTSSAPLLLYAVGRYGRGGMPLFSIMRGLHFETFLYNAKQNQTFGSPGCPREVGMPSNHGCNVYIWRFPISL